MVRSASCRQLQFAARDDVLLDLGRATADRVDDGVGGRTPEAAARGAPSSRASTVAPGPIKSSATFAVRLRALVHESLYCDDSTVERPPSRPRRSRGRHMRATFELRRELRDAAARPWRSRAAARRRGVPSHPLAERAHLHLERPDRHHREALEIDASQCRSILGSARRRRNASGTTRRRRTPRWCARRRSSRSGDRQARMVHRDQEQRDALVLVRPVRAPTSTSRRSAPTSSRPSGRREPNRRGVSSRVARSCMFAASSPRRVRCSRSRTRLRRG